MSQQMNLDNGVPIKRNLIAPRVYVFLGILYNFTIDTSTSMVLNSKSFFRTIF